MTPGRIVRHRCESRSLSVESYVFALVNDRWECADVPSGCHAYVMPAHYGERWAYSGGHPAAGVEEGTGATFEDAAKRALDAAWTP